MRRESETNRNSLLLKVQPFAAACLLTAALLLPHAPLVPVVAGMSLAGLIRWAWSRQRERRNGT